MNNFKSEDIIWEDYIEVAAEKYALYYEQDTMFIRWKAYEPHYFLRKDAVGTKEKQREELEKQFFLLKRRIQELLLNSNIQEEQIRQSIEKVFILREKYKCVFYPELDDLIKNLNPFREKLNRNLRKENSERGNYLSDNS